MKRSRILMIAGFGDTASMFEPVLATPLADHVDLIPINLPGFGAPRLESETSLVTLARWAKEVAVQHACDTIIAHSVASIIASLAASTRGSSLNRIISLEGNLTVEDAYFSGRAAAHRDAASFLDWFAPRLERKAKDDPILMRYADEVAKADPQALWELGCDAARFSLSHHPGELLRKAAESTYLYNPDNCAKASMDWLRSSGLSSIELPGASHWPTIDKTFELSDAVLTVVG